MRRALAIRDLIGLTKSLYEGNKSELVIHIKSEHDLRIKCEFRDDLFNTIKLGFISMVNENLPVFGIQKAKNLVDFCTTEKDVSRNISRVPLKLARILSEDIKIDKKEAEKKYAVSPKNEGMTFFDEEIMQGRTNSIRRQQKLTAELLSSQDNKQTDRASMELILDKEEFD